MTNGTKEQNQKMYKFRGKVFPAYPWIIQKLNIALAYNRSNERYEEVKP